MDAFLRKRKSPDQAVPDRRKDFYKWCSFQSHMNLPQEVENIVWCYAFPVSFFSSEKHSNELNKLSWSERSCRNALIQMMTEERKHDKILCCRNQIHDCGFTLMVLSHHIHASCLWGSVSQWLDCEPLRRFLFLPTDCSVTAGNWRDMVKSRRFKPNGEKVPQIWLTPTSTLDTILHTRIEDRMEVGIQGAKHTIEILTQFDSDQGYEWFFLPVEWFANKLDPFLFWILRWG